MKPWLVGIVVVTLSGCQPPAAITMKPSIVFVCVENSNRSQMAEAFARIHGGDLFEVFSAGSHPSGKVNPKAIAAMAEKGYDLAKHTSKGLNDLPAGQYAAAITMGCGDQCPNLQAKLKDDWPLPDPKTLPPEEFNKVRDEIEQRVIALLQTLSKSNGS